MFRWLLLISLALAAMAGLTLGVLNTEAVAVDLLIAEMAVPTGALMLGCFALGVICGLLLYLLLFAMPGRLRRRPAGSGSSDSRSITLPDA